MRGNASRDVLKFPCSDAGIKAGANAQAAQGASPAWDMRVRAMSIPAEELAKAGAPPAWATQALAEWCGRLVEVAKAALLLPADSSLEFAAPFFNAVPGAVVFVRSESFPRVSPGARLDVRVFPLWEPVWTWLKMEGFEHRVKDANDAGFWVHAETTVTVQGATVDALDAEAVVEFKTGAMRRVTEARRMIADAAASRKAGGADRTTAKAKAQPAEPRKAGPATDHPVTIARAVALIMRAVGEADPNGGDDERVKDVAFEAIGELVMAIHKEQYNERNGG